MIDNRSSSNFADSPWRVRDPLRRALAYGFLAVASGVILTGCTTPRNIDSISNSMKKDVKEAKNQFSQLKDVVVHDWNLSGRDDRGFPLWQLRAKEGRITGGDSLDLQRAVLTDAGAKLFQNGRIASNFQAKHIDFIKTQFDARLKKPSTLLLQMSGGVEAHSIVPQGKNAGALGSGPVNLQAPRLNVNVNAHRLLAPAGVQLTRGTGANLIKVNATRLTADVALTTAVLSGAVKAVSRDTTMESNAATWNWKSGRAHATGNVRATRADMHLSGNELDADTHVSTGTIAGNVEATANQGRASADKVDFNWQNGSILARGDVKLQRDGGTLSASRLDTDMKLTKAEASGGVSLQKGDATLTASRAQAYDKMTRATASGSVTLRRADLTVTADEAEATNISSQSALNVVATGGVTAHNNAGRVRANRVTWGHGRVLGTGNVDLSKDGNTLSGERMESDDRFQNATLTGDVHGTFTGGGTIRAKLLKKTGNKLSATGGVRAQRDNLKLRADRLDTTQSLEDLVLSGNVELRTNDGAIIHAPSMRYDKRLDKAYGSGGIDFVDPARGLRGKGKTVVISHVSDPKRREAVLTQVEGSGKQESLGNFKLF